jgi:kynurenine formamidase
VIVDIQKGKWEVITAEDLENARPKIEKDDIVIVHTGWHKKYSDSVEYFCYSPGLYKEAGEWFVEKGVTGLLCGWWLLWMKGISNKGIRCKV